MSTEDKCCTIVPYFKIHDGKMDEFRALCQRFVAYSLEEPDCLYYGFSFDGDEAHCREGYTDAEGLLTHIGHVGPLIEEAQKISEFTRIEVHGPADELEKLREPLTLLTAQFFTLEFGFRR